jgi:maleate isomerase
MSEQRFQEAMEKLLAATEASRTTLRVPEDGMYVLVAQAVAPGVDRLAGKDPADPRAMNTLEWILENRKPLIQDDCATAEIRPPQRLLGKYAVKSQMLIPVLVDERIEAVISVHSEPLRSWRDSDVRHAEQTAEGIAAAMAS